MKQNNLRNVFCAPFGLYGVFSIILSSFLEKSSEFLGFFSFIFFKTQFYK